MIKTPELLKHRATQVNELLPRRKENYQFQTRNLAGLEPESEIITEEEEPVNNAAIELEDLHSPNETPIAKEDIIENPTPQNEIRVSKNTSYTNSMVNSGVSRIVLLFCIIIGMALFVVWEKNKTIGLGYQIAQLQKNCNELSEKNRKLNYYVNRLKAPEVITLKIQSLKLPLIQQEETSYMTAMEHTQPKENAIKPKGTVLNKSLYTQKAAVLNCCPLHN